MNKEIRVITTMDYLTSHDLTPLRGLAVRVIAPNLGGKLDMSLVNKLFAAQVMPEFVEVDEDQIPFIIGYTFGRVLQSNMPTVLLSTEYKSPVYLPHKNGCVTDDITKAVFSNTELDEKKLIPTVTEENEAVVTAPAPKRSRAGRKPKVQKAVETVAEPVTEVVEEKPVVAEQPTTEVKNASADDVQAQVKKIVEGLNVAPLLKKYNVTEDDFYRIFITSVREAFEVVSFQMQLQVRFNDRTFTDELYKETKKSFDQLKKIVDKI
ncbi:hypothetical protein [Butyrivibrio sp.]|uniref:hypothetical protein n=1 Tax=Butyrivibrio sp. TaxID=28121 RepID=UPI0025C4FE42|nr:hypothetical protein [Butyrivibrio sp.]MBQ9303193.1 hypothetical protein [Butyrivibrio sp.]